MTELKPEQIDILKIGPKYIDCPTCPQCHFNMYVGKNGNWNLLSSVEKEWRCHKCDITFG